jgi:hypothetical protein
MLRKTLCVAGLVILTVAMSTAATRKQKPKAIHLNVPPTRGSVVLFTNFVGAYPFWDTTTGYFVDGVNFDNQVLAGGFTPSSNVTFSDVAMALGIYTPDGSARNGKISVYLESDAGGQPGSVIDGPLTQGYWVQDFQDGKGGGMVQFNCVTCPSLSAGTQYWVVAAQSQATVQDTWDFADTDASSPFAFNQVGSINGPWYVVSSGYTRMAWQADGN